MHLRYSRRERSHDVWRRRFIHPRNGEKGEERTMSLQQQPGVAFHWPVHKNTLELNGNDAWSSRPSARVLAGRTHFHRLTDANSTVHGGYSNRRTDYCCLRGIEALYLGILPSSSLEAGSKVLQPWQVTTYRPCHQIPWMYPLGHCGRIGCYRWRR